MDGMAIVDKPSGITSGAAVKAIRKRTGTRKAGHSGSLDKNASGMLIVATGKATKALKLLSTLDKQYCATITLHSDRKKADIKHFLRGFAGKNIQLPPKRSAVVRRKRAREIYSLEIADIQERKICLRLRCESGFYVRRLATDLGGKMGCAAHLSSLRRTSIGPFEEGEMKSIEKISEDDLLSVDFIKQRLMMYRLMVP